MADSLIVNKRVDWSLLNDGFTIPLCFHDVIYKQIGKTLARGEKFQTTILIDGFEYKAQICNLKFDGTKYDRKDILQVRYNKGSAISKKLREIFSSSYDELLMLRQDKPKRAKIEFDSKAYFTLYSTPVQGSFRAECITENEYQIAKDEVAKIDERQFEIDTDDSSSIVLSPGMLKIRKMNKAVGNTLKQLYKYRCQICGQYIGEVYGSTLIHAHHIEYFVKSMNNDSDNIMIVCPNHHGIIHATNPEFNREKLIYKYPNGYEEGLKINKHL